VAERAEQASDAPQLPQVGLQRLADAGVLHLDRDRHGLGVRRRAPCAPVHLTETGGAGGRVLDREARRPVATELGVEDALDAVPRQCRGGVLQRVERCAVRLGELLGQHGLEHAERLAELERAALPSRVRHDPVAGAPELTTRRR